jgi:predicted AAA+ superfamily ATPase
MSILQKRTLNLPKNHHFFLFGARGTGKSTLLRTLFESNHTLYIDLLITEQEERYSLRPDALFEVVAALPNHITHIIIDEVQKVPKLLNVVHSLIEKKQKTFVMTGSSARKLKYGGANLLAGRAFVYHLFPLSFEESDKLINLSEALQFGQLPKLLELESAEQKRTYLRSYANTYLKEEVWGEQLVRKLPPFRRFLEVAAQSNGKIINMSSIARDVGIDDKTVQSYFSILEDTLLGFLLEPFQHSFRKRLSQKPKFYFFDLGVTRALCGRLTLDVLPKTSAYGEAFEHFVILECHKLAAYHKEDYRFSYLRTKDDVEIDLIVERPGKPLLCIEIKSSERISPESIASFIHVTKEIPNCEAICICNDSIPQKIEHVLVLPWQEALKRYFT